MGINNNVQIQRQEVGKPSQDGRHFTMSPLHYYILIFNGISILLINLFILNVDSTCFQPLSATDVFTQCLWGKVFHVASGVRRRHVSTLALGINDVLSSGFSTFNPQTIHPQLKTSRGRKLGGEYSKDKKIYAPNEVGSHRLRDTVINDIKLMRWICQLLTSTFSIIIPGSYS